MIKSTPFNSKKFLNLGFASLAVAALASCSESEPTPDENVNDNKGSFVFATTSQGSGSTTSNVLLTGDAVDNGTLSTVGNGLLNDGATYWMFYKNYLYALTYNQGNAGTTRSYILDANGNLKARDMEYRISRFTSYGTYENDIITSSTGDGPTSQADANGYLPKTLLLTYLDVVNETSRSNDTGSGAYSVENYLGNGEYVTLAGVLQSGQRIYSGAIPMGLSQYGAAADGGKWVRDGFGDLVHKEAGGSNSSAYKKGELTGTQYPDECWVAVYANSSMLNPTLVHTNRISYPCGRYKSQYYQTIWTDSKGDIYVFSPSFAKSMTDSRQRTTLSAGVCRIPAGATAFDDYYVNLEAQTTNGNRSFMRCWHAGGSYFLMQMYDRPLTEANPAATELALFNATTGKLTYVSGLPADVTSIGKSVYASEGKVYIPINVANELPAIYGIELDSAKASRGVTIEALDITGFGYLNRIQ